MTTPESQDQLYFALQTFTEVNRIITSSHNSDETLSRTVKMIAQRIHVDACSIYIYDADRGILILKATHGLDPSTIETVQMLPSEGLVGLVLERSEPVQEFQMQEHPRFKAFPQTNEDSFSSFLGVPLIEHRKSFGVLVVHTVEPRTFPPEEIQILSSIATQISSLVSKALLLKQLDIATQEPTTSKNKEGKTLQMSGQPVAYGVAVGKAIVLKQSEIDEPLKSSSMTFQEEMSDFQAAMDHTISDTLELIDKVTDLVGTEEASIFHAHLMFLEDQHFQEKIKSKIQSGNTAAWSIYQAVHEYLLAFAEIKDPYLSEKGSDLKDVGYRLLHYLGHEVLSITKKTGILVVRQLLPGDIARMDTTRIKGIILSSGGVVSHAAILARSLRIPAVCLEDHELDKIKDGIPLAINGDTGTAVAFPNKTVLKEFKQLLVEQQDYYEHLEEFRDLPCKTSDGVRISLMANVALESDQIQLPRYGAEGVGLFRSEIFYLSLDRYPDLSEQTLFYRNLLENIAEDKPVIFRTLDVGADKAAPYMGFQDEENPFLGYRAVRRQLKQKTVLKEQLRALLLATGQRPNVRLLFPMITNVTEIIQAKLLFEECRKEVEATGAKVAKIEVGMMFEVPSAFLICEKFMPEIDFCSIGSNDLTQYVLAVDRNNPQISDLYDPLHPAVLQLIQKLADTAERHHKSVELCGEMASDPDGCVILVGLGIKSLSMNAPLIPVVKKRLSEIALPAAKSLAQKALNATSPEEVREMIRVNFPDSHS
ncbi:MAG: phosphoenolpyruvate--protein phosphotransferase [SAR324 cluster bacterium]|nr:phosphoenolpyruvate--protein phosphotransferase [SAR324 cluster bacterium]MBL7035874.1 phosphoenolpyruvate--protein phosphotransferase [SAR324 cluster bacterium]